MVSFFGDIKKAVMVKNVGYGNKWRVIPDDPF